MISVVVPTITGREDSLARCLASYEDTLELQHEIVVVKDLPNWPSACNEGFRRSHGDIIHFTADDLEAVPGWHEEVLPWIEGADELPAAKVLNHSIDGDFDNAQDGPDGAIVWFTRVPIMRRDQYDRIGPWPEIDYYADVWLSERGCTLGIETRMFYSYCFIHHWHKVGRLDDDANLARAWRQYRELGR